MYRYETVLFHDVLTKNTKPYSVRKELISDVGAMISHPVRKREREGPIKCGFQHATPFAVARSKKNTNKQRNTQTRKQRNKKGFDPMRIRSCRALRICGVLNLNYELRKFQGRDLPLGMPLRCPALKDIYCKRLPSHWSRAGSH